MPVYKINQKLSIYYFKHTLKKVLHSLQRSSLIFFNVNLLVFILSSLRFENFTVVLKCVQSKQILCITFCRNFAGLQLSSSCTLVICTSPNRATSEKVDRSTNKGRVVSEVSCLYFFNALGCFQFCIVLSCETIMSGKIRFT